MTEAIIPEKVCRKCSISQPFHQFHRSSNHKYGYKNTCKTCTRQIWKEYRTRPEFIERQKINNRRKYKRYCEAPVFVEEKQCSTCKIIKPASEFRKNTGSRDGLRSQCRDCIHIKEAAQWQGLKVDPEKYRQHLDRMNQFTYDRYRTDEGYLKTLDYRLRSKFGITLDDYNQMLDIQNHVCAICGGTNGDQRLQVDHDHVTGAIRGLLCRGCNSGLGHFRDSSQLIAAALEYLSGETNDPKIQSVRRVPSD